MNSFDLEAATKTLHAAMLAVDATEIDNLGQHFETLAHAVATGFSALSCYPTKLTDLERRAHRVGCQSNRLRDSLDELVRKLNLRIDGSSCDLSPTPDAPNGSANYSITIAESNLADALYILEQLINSDGNLVPAKDGDQCSANIKTSFDDALKATQEKHALTIRSLAGK